MFGLSKKEEKFLRTLSTPIKIQNFLDSLPLNWEKGGETYMSPRRVLSMKRAHCLEGALLAAVSLWLQGEKPLLLDLKTINGDDHVVALYQKNNYWGAISKTNHSSLRFRDPIYKTIREITVSYFHEYFSDETGQKILISYSRPFDLSLLGESWVTANEELFDLAQKIDDSRHFVIFPKKNKRYLRPADKMERKAGLLREWTKKNKRA